MNEDKLKAVIEKLENTLIDEAIEDLKSFLPEPKWEPKGGDFFVRGDGDVGEYTSTESCRINGAEWTTKRQAQIAAKKVQIFQWLLHMASESGDEETNIEFIIRDFISAATKNPTHYFSLYKKQLGTLPDELRELMEEK